MLLWINGPFGVGKTQTAHAIARRLPNAFLCDPEQLGFGIARMTPPELRGDFQDVPLWCEGVRRVLDRNLTHFPGVVLVPMTLVNPDYFDEVVAQQAQLPLWPDTRTMPQKRWDRLKIQIKSARGD